MKSTQNGKELKGYSAILTIKKPGAMTAKQRRDIAMWLHFRAESLIKDGKNYNDTGNFRARYMEE